jgi:hypothetical protein
MSNGNGGLSFGRMVGGAVTLLVVAVTIWSIIWGTVKDTPIEWAELGGYMKDAVPLVLASYGVTKLKEAVGDVWGKKK